MAALKVKKEWKKMSDEFNEIHTLAQNKLILLLF